MKRVILIILLLIPNLCLAEWLPKDSWTLIYTNSENTDGYDEQAKYAIDGDVATHWMSRHRPGTPDPHPHEIQVDMGASQLVDGFSYLPRQSTNTNGFVRGYAFYVSDNLRDWGSPVAMGELVGGLTEKTVDFVPKQGRYFRFVSLSEQKTPSLYTVAAEIGVRKSNAQNFLVGTSVKATFDPSPDSRVTGHNLYWTGPAGVENKIDLKTSVFHIFDPLPVGTYKLTATAYGLVDGTVDESVHSPPCFFNIKNELSDPESTSLIPPNVRVEAVK